MIHTRSTNFEAGARSRQLAGVGVLSTVARLRETAANRRSTNFGNSARLGVVTHSSGGNAGSFTFDPATGLSKDARLAYYLQDLTPAQLQAALNGEDPSNEIRQLLYEEATATGRGSLPCGTPDNPTCGPDPAASFPAWVWIAGGTVAAVLIAGVMRR